MDCGCFRNEVVWGRIGVRPRGPTRNDWKYRDASMCDAASSDYAEDAPKNQTTNSVDLMMGGGFMDPNQTIQVPRRF